MPADEASTWRLVITGCGTSHGNPPWGLPTLWSTDPRDRRRRSGALLLGPAGQVILIDAGPDLAHQLRDPFADWDGTSYPARAVTRCDGALITHVHADHVHGINDLRHLNRLMGGRPISLHGAAAHLRELRRMFRYCFAAADGSEPSLPVLTTRPVVDGRGFVIAGMAVTPIVYSHGPAGPVTGWLLGGRCAYLTDCKTLPAAARARLRNLDLVVLTMLQEDPHPTHCNWEEARRLAADLAPDRTVFTHLGYSVRCAEWMARLPPGMELARDGLVLPFIPEVP